MATPTADPSWPAPLKIAPTVPDAEGGVTWNKATLKRTMQVNYITYWHTVALKLSYLACM